MKGRPKAAKLLSFLLAITMVMSSGAFSFAFAETGTSSADQTASETDTKSDTASDTATKSEKQVLTAKASDGAKITVTAPAGAFDEDVTLQVKTVSSDSVQKAIQKQDQNAADFAAYDITILDKNGDEVQPTKAVSVKIKGADVEGEASAVYHVNDAKTTAEPVTADTKGSNASFEAEHFSIYVVVGEEPALTTYEFYSGDDMVDSQTVKNGESLEEPETEAKDGYIFSGWYTAATGGQKFDAFGKQTVTEPKTVKLYARYSEAKYVFFMDGTDSDARVIRTKSGVAGDKVSTSDVTFAVSGDESITGWYTDKDLTDKVESVTLAGEDVYLYPKVEKGYWVTYESNGGTYIAPSFYTKGSSAEAPTDPTKAGYTFDGWYTDKDLTTKADFDKLSGDATVYAKWKTNTSTKYTLVYWIENADDDDYSYDKSTTATGTTGAEVSLTSSQTSTSNLSDSSHFTYNSDKTTEALKDVTIAGDGSTVVNVYFSRNTYTLTFRTQSWGGYETVATISAKYNAKISDKFNEAPFNTTYNGRAWKCTDRWKYEYALQTLDRMPGFDATFNLYKKSSETLKTITYYVESVKGANTNPNTWPTSTAGFDKLKEVKTYFTYATYDEEYHEIQGFTRYSSSVAGFRDNTKNFNNNALVLYYMRNSYTLTFHNVDSDVKTESVKYEAPLKSYYDYTPSRPSSLDDSYEFKGWYTSPGCEDGTEVKTDGTMPAGNVIVYAKWAPKQYTVTAHGTSDKAVKVDKGSTVSPSDFDSVKPEVAEDEQWMGWYLRSGEEGEYVYTTFNYATKINKDYELYPYIVSKSKFKVTYDAGEGSGTVPTDNSKYAKSSKAKVKSKGDLTGPEGKTYFLGWKSSQDGKIYQPGDKITITGDVTLTAQWGKKPADATLTYTAGTGSGDDQSATLKNNGSVTLKDAGDMGFSKAGYTFIGWQYENNEGQTVIAQAGDTIHVDTDTAHANEVTALWAKVTADSGEWVYDGKSHSKTPSVEAEGGVKYALYYKVGDEEWTTEAPSITDVGEKEVSVEARADGYPTLQATYTLKVTPKTVTFTGKTATKVYNGSEQKITEITEDGLISGHEYSGLTYAAKGTDVGEYDGEFSGEVVIQDAKGNDVTKNYKVTKKPGTLTITPVTDEVVVTITENNGTYEYDGTEKKVTGYTVSINNSLYQESDFDFSGTDRVTGTDAGTYDMELKASDFKNTNDNFENVKFVIVDGQLKITKKEVTFTGESASKVYNREEQEITGITQEGLVDGHEYSGLTYSAKGTKVGSYDGSFSGKVAIKDAKGNDVTKNYKVTEKPGELTITPITDQIVVTIKENSGTYEYDGTQKKVTGYTVSINNDKYTEDDFTFSGDATVKGTDAGSYDMELKPSDFKNTNDNFENVKFVIEDGQLKITKKEVTFTGESASKVYNRKEQEITGITQEGLVDGHEYSGLTYSAMGTNVGKYDGEFSGEVVIKDARGNDVTKNYKVTKKPGNLTITPVTDEVVVTITENSGTYEYDGTEKKVTGYTVSINNDKYQEKDFQFSGDATVTGTDAGRYDMELKAADFQNTNDNFENVKFVIKDGQLKITKKEVTFTGESADKVYNRKEQEITGITQDGLVDGHEFSGLTYSAKGTRVGEYDGEFSGDVVIQDAKGNDVTENYKVTKKPGKLTITEYTDEIIVTIKENSGTYEYDGAQKKVTGYTVSINNDKYNEDDFTFSGDATVKGTDAGSYDMELKPSDFKNTNDNFENVTFVIEDGQLKITKKEVTFTGESADKVYNRKQQEITGITQNGLVDGHEFSGLTYSAKGTDVGEYDGSFSGDVVIQDAKGNDVTKNYKVTKKPGTLNITPVTDEVVVTITENSGTYEYDGTEKKVTGYTVSINNDNYKEKDFTFSGDATVKGTEAGTYDMELKASDFQNTNDNFENVKFVIKDGQLKITKKEVTFTGESASKVYNRKQQEITGITQEGLLEGHEYSGLTYSAKGTDVGKYDGSFSGDVVIQDAKGNDVTKNYKVTKKPGTLNITAVTDEVVVTITENSGTYEYDGTEKKVTGYTVSINNDNYKEKDFTFSGDATVKGTEAGTYDMELKAADFQNTNDNFQKVKFVIEDDQLKITKADIHNFVTLTPKDVEKVYDGESLSAGEATAKDRLGSNELKIEYSVDGEKWTEDFNEITATNVKDSKTVQVRVSDASGKKGNYDGYVEATETITITPATIKVVTPDAKKHYDGKPLTKEGSISGLVKEETVTFKTTGTQTKVGKSNNTYKLVWDGTAIESNYTVDEEIGVLEVLKENKTNQPDKTKKDDNTPSTGDDSNVALYGIMGLTALLGEVFILLFRRRKENE